MHNKNIYMKSRLLPPAVYLLFLAVLWFISPISQFLSPPHADSVESLETFCGGNNTYITTTLTRLHFSGYTHTLFGHTKGYYYYTFHENRCLLFLLSPDTCKNGTPLLDQCTVRVQKINGFKDYDRLTAGLADDLNWTASAIRSRIPDYVLSEPAAKNPLSILLAVLYFLSGIYALADFFIHLYHFFHPVIL